LRLRFNNDDEFLEKIMLRLSNTARAFDKLFEIVSTSKIDDFAKTVGKYGFSTTDIMLIFTGLFVHLILETFEMLKNLILMITERKNFDYNGKQYEITGNETLGQLLDKLDLLLQTNKIKENLNNELRGALAHGTWWAIDRTFYYRNTKNEEKTYTIQQFLEEAHNLTNFTKVFYEAGYKRVSKLKEVEKYEPESDL
jgi:hypothetical protein